jgi:hypothetical protein
MLPHEQLVFGVTAGLFLYTLLYWSPGGWRDLLAAIVAAGLMDFALINHVRREIDAAGVFITRPGDIVGSPHFRLGIALAFASISAARRAMRDDRR